MSPERNVTYVSGRASITALHSNIPDSKRPVRPRNLNGHERLYRPNRPEWEYWRAPHKYRAIAIITLGAAMNSKEIVQRFVTECERVKMAHDLFSALFDPCDDRKRDLFQSVAPKTFGHLNEILIDYMLLQFAKLTDLANTMGHDNLTSSFIVEKLPWPLEVKERLSAINARLMNFRGHVKEYRTKRGAHLDLEAHKSNARALGAFPQGADDNFLRDLQEFLQVAMAHVDPNEHVTLQIAMSEDVHRLALALAKSVGFDQCPTCPRGNRAEKVLDILGR
jgi:hypothetical protein